jgi:hypothetical protein
MSTGGVLGGAWRTSRNAAGGIGGNRAPAAPGQRAALGLLCTIEHLGGAFERLKDSQGFASLSERKGVEGEGITGDIGE